MSTQVGELLPWDIPTWGVCVTYIEFKIAGLGGFLSQGHSRFSSSALQEWF